MKKVCVVGLLILLSHANTAWADTEILPVHFLPLNEAIDLVNTQLSATGRVSALPSRRVLVVEDDKKHLKKAKKLLEKLDVATQQYTVNLTFNMIKKQQLKQTKSSATLPGGWIKISPKSNSSSSRDKQRFQLAVSANQRASIETGELRSYRKNTRAWFTSHGLIKHRSVELIPITSGFYISIRQVDNNQVRVHLQPWMRRTAASPHLQGQTEILLDLDSSSSPQLDLSHQDERHLNVLPRMTESPIIELIAAATDIIIPIGETTTIAATDHEAQQLGTALLSRYSMSGNKALTITLSVH